jgi:large subunit ribosomal protein L21
VSTAYTLLEDKVNGAYTVERKPVFAVVEIAGTQYKVTPDDLIITEKIRGVDVNDKIRLNKVLLLGSKTETIIGRPYVEEASVTAAVEEQFLDGKVIVFKKRRRKNSRRTNGHRQPLTSLRILSIDEGTLDGQTAPAGP